LNCLPACRARTTAPPCCPVAPTTALLIEPDGALDLVPFEALVDQHGRYLADRFSLAISPGLEYLAAARPWQVVSRHSRALVVGDPSSAFWSTLPQAEIEARDVASFFEDSHLLLHKAASYSAIARELPEAEVFHFAGHAIVSANDAGLVLAGSDLLDVLKLDALPFGRNKLVVLSACSSAQGPAGMFNDVDSTPRLFAAAVVPEVVASRWVVDSGATASLMKQFYTQLLGGNSVSDSLQAAAASLRAQPNTTHPFYWASFAVFGKG
jgi:CHAT domain-containing protein